MPAPDIARKLPDCSRQAVIVHGIAVSFIIAFF
jgi:hypothetical protein